MSKTLNLFLFRCVKKKPIQIVIKQDNHADIINLVIYSRVKKINVAIVTDHFQHANT